MRRYGSVVVGFVALVSIVGLAASGVLAQGKGDAKAGKAVYDAQCAKCHGETGAGDGAQGQKLKDKPSNWTAGGAGLKGMDDQKIFDSIAKGGKAIGKSAAMPAYPKLSEAEVWNLVAYVKSLVK
jgi:mono/diheme cytochrome c family protein